MTVDGNIFLGSGATILTGVTSRTANVLGPGTLALVVNTNIDDDSQYVALPFTVSFNGTNYSGVYVGSNGYLLFGGGSSDYYGLGPSDPMFPGIQINAADRSMQRLYTGSEDGNATFRIRYEGYSSYNGVPGGSNIFWEVTFSAASPGTFQIDIGSNASAGDGASGITDGTNYLATFDAGTANIGYTLVFTTVADCFTLTAKGGATRQLDGGLLSVPLLAVAATGDPGNPDNRTYDGGVGLPAWQVAAALSAPMLADGAVNLGNPANLAPLGTTPFSLSASALTGGGADGAITLPQYSVSASRAADGAITLETPTLAAAAVAGAAADGAATLQVTLSATLLSQGLLAGAVTLPAPLLAALASGQAGVSVALTLPVPIVAAAGAAGNLIAGAATLPDPSVAATAFADGTASADLTLPLYVLAASASAPAGSTYYSITLNTRTSAVTTYDNLPTNSLCLFNGVVLAATADGVVALTGDTDRGAPIAASMTSGQLSFDSPHLKRVNAGYVGYRASGGLNLTLTADEGTPNSYDLEPRAAGLHPSRVLTGRGVRGRYWRWQLANRAGADFAVDALAFDADVLERRI